MSHPFQSLMLCTGYMTRVADMASERNEDGKSYKNVQHCIKSKSYCQFTHGITNGSRGAFDVHIYHMQVSRMPWPLLNGF
jgi:hypothetical protein